MCELEAMWQEAVMGQEAMIASLLSGAHSSSVGLQLNHSLWAAEGPQQIHAGQLCKCAHYFEGEKKHCQVGKSSMPWESKQFLAQEHLANSSSLPWSLASS